MPDDDNLMLSKALAVAATEAGASNSTLIGSAPLPKMRFPSSNLPVVTQVDAVLNWAVTVESCKPMPSMSSLTRAKMSEASLADKSCGKFVSLSTVGSGGCGCRVWGWESANDVGESKLGGAPGTAEPWSGFINEPGANWTVPSGDMVGEMLVGVGVEVMQMINHREPSAGGTRAVD